MATRMQQRRGTEAQWTSANPVLAAGEIGFEIDTNKFKIGDGINLWDDLSYFLDMSDLDLSGALEDYVLESRIGAALGLASLDSNGQVPLTQLENLIADAPEILDNLSEIATAIDSTTGLVQQRIDLSLEPVIQSIEDGFDSTSSSITAIQQDVSDLTNSTDSVASSVTQLQTDVAAAGVDIVTLNSEVGNLQSSVSSVEGDVSVLTSDLSNLTSTVSGNYTTLEGNLSTHASDTTNVHGIADTSVLVTTTDLATKQDKVTGVSDTEIGYLDGVTSAIQTQINNKAASSHNHVVADVTGLQTALDAKASLAGAVFTGNVEVDGNLVVDGNFTVNGTNFNASATTITIEDSLVQLAHQNPANTVDLGIVVAYNDGAAKHAGIVRDVSDNTWKLFQGVTTEPTTTVNFAQGSLDNLALNNVTVAGVVFTDGTQTKQGVPSITTISQKVASYTLSNLNERDTLVEISNASPTTLTIPTDATVNYPVGTTIDVLQTNTGQVTIAGAGGVTVNSTPGLKLRTRWSSATLLKRAANTWVVYGDLTA